MNKIMSVDYEKQHIGYRNLEDSEIKTEQSVQYLLEEARQLPEDSDERHEHVLQALYLMALGNPEDQLIQARLKNLQIKTGRQHIEGIMRVS